MNALQYDDWDSDGRKKTAAACGQRGKYFVPEPVCYLVSRLSSSVTHSVYWLFLPIAGLTAHSTAQDRKFLPMLQ